MKSRGDETSKAKTEKSSGDARPSQDKASRRLSERLESLAVEKKPVDEEANGSGAKQATGEIEKEKNGSDIEKNGAAAQQAAGAIDIDVELIKFELERIAAEGELSWPETKPDFAPYRAMPAPAAVTFESPRGPHVGPFLNNNGLAQPEKHNSSPTPNISASQVSTVIAETNDGGHSQKAEPAGPLATDAHDPSVESEDLWMGEEIGAPRPMAGFSEDHSGNREIPIRTDLAAMRPDNEYEPDLAGSDPVAYGKYAAGRNAGLPQITENSETAIDITEGLRTDYPELRPLREAPQDSMLGFYVSLALVFICSTFGTLYVLNQLDAGENGASVGQKVIAPISPTDSTASAKDLTASASETSGTETQEIAAAAGESTASSGEAQHPLLAALDKSAAEKFTAPSPAGSPSPIPPQKFTIENISGHAGMSLPVDINLPDEQLSDNAYVVFRGMPTESSLSKGRKRDDSWAVRVSDLAGLALNTPADYSGSFIMEVILVRGDDVAPETRISAVDITPAPGTMAKETAPGAMKGMTPTGVASVGTDKDAASETPGDKPAEASGQMVSEKTEHQVRILSESQEISMLSRGANLMDDGDISGARLIFEYLAEQGSALGAVAFAKSFDPNLFEKGYIKGPQPSTEDAMKWYRRAAELGNKEAISRLNTLRAMTKIQ